MLIQHTFVNQSAVLFVVDRCGLIWVATHVCGHKQQKTLEHP